MVHTQWHKYNWIARKLLQWLPYYHCTYTEGLHPCHSCTTYCLGNLLSHTVLLHKRLASASLLTGTSQPAHSGSVTADHLICCFCSLHTAWHESPPCPCVVHSRRPTRSCLAGPLGKAS